MQPSVIPGRSYQRIDRVSRLLFHWRADDLSLTPLTGQVPTFTRASDGYTIDSLGMMRKCVHSQPRWCVPLDANGVRKRAGLLLEGTRTNLITDSDDLSIWTSTGTPLVTAAFTTLGDLSLTLLEDDDGAVAEFKSQNVTFTGDAIKVVLYYVRAPNTPSDGNLSIFAIRDTTASANRLRITHTWNADSTLASATATTGTVIKTEKLGNDPTGRPIYAVYCQTTSVTAANINRAEAKPSGDTASDLGKMVIGGVMVENATFPSVVRQKTSGGTATRNIDSLTATVGLEPRDLTVFGRLARPIWADITGGLGGSPTLTKISGVEPQIFLRAISDPPLWSSLIAVSPTTAQATLSMPVGVEHRISAQFRNLRQGGFTKLDVGLGFGTEAGPATAFSAFGNQIVSIGGGGGTEELYGLLFELKIAIGLYNMAQMEQLF